LSTGDALVTADVNVSRIDSVNDMSTSVNQRCTLMLLPNLITDATHIKVFSQRAVMKAIRNQAHLFL